MKEKNNFWPLLLTLIILISFIIANVKNTVEAYVDYMAFIITIIALEFMGFRRLVEEHFKNKEDEK